MAPDIDERALNELEIDMTTGLHMTLDRKARTLSISYNGIELCTVQKLRGKTFYPYVLFHKVTPFPIEIDYLEGPEGQFHKVRPKYIELTAATSRDTCQIQQSFCSLHRLVRRKDKGDVWN